MGLINLNNEQKMIQNEVKKFTLQEIEPIVQEIEKNASIPEVIFRKLNEFGILSPIIPQEFGGAGFDTTSLCIIIEELSKVCASVGLVIAVNNGLVAYSLMKSRNEKSKTYLKRLGNGELGGFDIDFDKNLQIISQNPLKINGRSRFVLSGAFAKFLLLDIKTENGWSLYLIESPDKSKITNPYLLGMRSAGIVDITFNNLEIPDDFCLLDSTVYITAIEETRDYFNLCLSAVGLGIAQAALDASIKYAKERRQFNRPICEFPMVQEMLAEMKIKIESSRKLLYDAANRYDSKEDYKMATKLAFASNTEAAVYCGIKGVQIFGGYGYTKDYPVERYLRDAKTGQILGESPVKLKENIARELLG
uniref:Acyl-CoA dehydrogenase n=1 Tax=candidate division WOR-3 bacterium TaxID=2052148 RepID=A0A7V1EIE8_UNCW3